MKSKATITALLIGWTLLSSTVRADEIPFDIFSNGYLGIGFRAPVVPDVLARLRLSEKFSAELLRKDQIIFDLGLDLSNYSADKADAQALAGQFKAQAEAERKGAAGKATVSFFIGLGGGVGAGAGAALIIDGLIRNEAAPAILGGVLILGGIGVVIVIELPAPLKLKI